MSLLTKLGLGRRELRAWAFYDWGNSAFINTMISALFPIYFGKVASAGVSPAVATERLALATTLALALIAVVSPLLGAIADRAPIKKTFLAVFTALGVAATAGMVMVGPGDWKLALILFGIGNVAANGAFVFYDALLPHIAKPNELDRVSTAGYALGYAGGGLMLTLNAIMILKPGLFGLSDPGAAVRASFILTAIWWAAFALPLFRHVPEPPIHGTPAPGNVITGAFRQLGDTFRALVRFKQAFLLLIAFLIYNDGIGTIFRMAVSFGDQIGLESGDMISALILVQVISIPATFAFASIAGRIGTKPAILIGLAVYCCVSVIGYFMTTATDFFVLASIVGVVQGGTQALSRSLFASMIPKARSSEFFGLFAVFEKFAGILGPLIFTLVTSAFGSSRPAILSIIGFFAVGGVLLTFVDVAAGRAAAEAANRDDDAATLAA